MKISRISLKLLFLALLFFLAWYYAGIASRNYNLKNAQEMHFGLSDSPEDLNYWDFAVIGFLVLGTSSIVAAVWLRNFDR